MKKPICIDLFCGKFGWGQAFADEGYHVVGFDLAHEDYHGSVPQGCELVLQDVLTLHGAQFRDAACIVASPPCQRYSYMAMPWTKAKREIKWQDWQRTSPFSPGFDLNDLFDACFRIQREASEAVGHHIPMIVENVKGAQRWVGSAAWHYGSFYLWGDVPALMPLTHKGSKVPGISWSGSDKPGYVAKAFNGTAEQRLREGRKNNGGRWFAIGSPGQKETGKNPVHEATKNGGNGSWFGKYSDRKDRWEGNQSLTSSRSSARKSASAEIARIPYELASHIARCFKPESCERMTA